MKKLLVISIFLISFLFPNNLYAKDFQIDADVTYEINKDSATKIIHNIRLKNLTTEKYSPKFTFSLFGLDIDSVRAYDSNGDINVDLVEQNNESIVTINFSDSLVGKDKYRDFVLEISDNSLLKKTGDIWEINIPKLSKNTNFDKYDVRFKVPKSIGDLAYMVPESDSYLESDSFYTYYFNREKLEKSGVSAAFGSFQTFSFDLSYHLENQLVTPSSSSISLPPDTQYQQVYYEKLTPKPEKIRITEEGNWIADYNLGPRERVDIRLVGYVKIFSSPVFKETVSEQYLADNLKSTTYWQVDNPEIVRLANELKRPENIYKYVVDNLKYNYKNASPTAKRLGAAAALNLPDQAICTEFTDLFIALTRAAGIPAREVNGYAATENPNLQPLSLVADVLHAWPEYWDYDRGVWVPVDPTWGHTTGGVDYFSKLDLRHFAFVFHGTSDTEPSPPGSYKLGDNPQKDIYVNFSELPSVEKSQPIIEINQSDGLVFMSPNIIVKIYNPGPTAIYNKEYKVESNNGLLEEGYINTILPFNTYKIKIAMPYGILGADMPDEIIVEVEGSKATATVNKSFKVFRDITIVLTIIFVIVSFVFLYFKRK